MKLKKILLVLLVLACVLCASACGQETVTHNITFVDHDGSVLLELTVEDGAMPEYTLANPEREATAQYSYEFLGWDKQVSPAAESVTYKAIYSETVNKYNVVFADEDGTVLETKELEYGKTPFYSGSTPTKDATAEYTYAFEGWDKELAAVTGDVTYTAVYGPTKNEYKITFVDLAGKVLYETMVEYGELPVYAGETPTLAGDVQYSYVFKGWTPELESVKGVATYRPVFEQVVNEYEITFKDEEGNVLQTGKVPYGRVPEFTGTLPLPEDTTQYDYSGAWDKEIVAVTGEATYTYLVTRADMYYTVTFKNGDVVLAEKLYKYGETPAYELVPHKASTAEALYTFKGWDNELAAVTGHATYNAVYTEAENTFELVVDHVTVDGLVAADRHSESLTENKLYAYTAPTVEGKTASHQYVNYYYNGEKLLITIYYSEVDVWDGSSVSTSFAGSGTAEDPYLISSGADLALLRDKVQGGDKFTGKYFKMTKSIDLNSFAMQIGREAPSTSSWATLPTLGFGGIFDGNNCAILNLATYGTPLSSADELNGLFKTVFEGGKIANLSTYGAITPLERGTSALAGRNFGTIKNCTNYASILPTAEITGSSELYRYIGALVSVNYGSIDSCVNYGEIYGEEYASGIVARSDKGEITNCVNYGSVKGSGNKNAGICGEQKGGSIIGCVNYGTITNIRSTGNFSYVGGIVGYAATVVKDCENYGTITSTVQMECLGGIAGYTVATAEVSDCVNYGAITGHHYLGGIIGMSKGKISNCENHADVYGRQWIGGIVGRSYNNISDCTNNGSVEGYADFIGGIVAASDGTTRTISGCVNNGAVKGSNFVAGIDGRPYAGTVTYDKCINNGTVTATSSYAGGIAGRSNTDSAKAILTNCQSHGKVSATYPGAFVGIDKATDTTGCTIEDSCTTTLRNMYYVGYDELTKTHGTVETEFDYFKITFVDEQGNVLQESQVKYGVVPTFEGTLPTLPEGTDYYSYSGAWDKKLVAAKAEATYTYVISIDYVEYTVKFLDEDGTLLYETLVEWGQTPVYSGVQPTKEGTSEYLYQFNGWTPELTTVTGEATYTATYEQIVTPYDVIIYHVDLNGAKVADDYVAELTEEKLYTYTAPTVEGKTASHQYLNYRYEGEKVLITIYYSEVDVWDGTSVSESFKGSGTAEDPYLISSGADLALLRATVNGGDTLAGKYFKMTKSIDLKSVSLMIGNESISDTVTTAPTVAFAGIFDGNNCAILNIKTKETGSGYYNGLFKALLAGGKVCNLSTYGACNQVVKFNGVIVGFNFGTVENCTNYASITPADVTAITATHRYTGAIASINNGDIISCVNYGTIYGQQYASGIVSRMVTGTIKNCINYANITGSGMRPAGICGQTDKGTVSNCTNYGDVTGTQHAAGIIANNAAVISGCDNYGNVTQTSSETAGGIAGYSAGDISNSNNYGDVTGVNKYVGGIVGNTTAAVTNCNNYGAVATTGNYNYIAGIVGKTTAAVSNCNNYGATVKGYQYTGGIVGDTTAAVSNCNNYGATVKGYEYVGGVVGKTTAAISDCVNYADVSGRQWIGGIVGDNTGNITNCTNNGNVTGSEDFVGGIVGASRGTTRTISNCINYGAIKGVGYVGGIDGRPYEGTVTYKDCINNGTVTATSEEVGRGSAGGIMGRSDKALGIMIDCQSNGAVTATSAGAYIGYNSTTTTTGYTIYDSCSTKLTGNAIGYDVTEAAGIALEGFAYTKTEVESEAEATAE